MSNKLSVVIPFFNRMEYIPQLIESIPAWKDIEILIVDDKSTAEETAQLLGYINAQQETRDVHYFYNDGTKSAGACRNIGLANATGEWVLFADSDDYFVPCFGDVLSPWLQSEYDIVYFTPTSIDRATGAETERHRGFADWVSFYLANPCAATEYRLKSFYVVPWSKLYRRDFLVAHGVLFDEVIASNDVMFSVRAAFAAERFAASTDVIYCVTKSPGSLIYSVDRAVLDARLGVFITRYNFLKVRVPREIFCGFRLNGRNNVLAYLAQKQGAGATMGAVYRLIRGGVPVFEVGLLNPVRVVRAAKGHWKKHNRNRNYYNKEQKQSEKNTETV